MFLACHNGDSPISHFLLSEDRPCPFYRRRTGGNQAGEMSSRSSFLWSFSAGSLDSPLCHKTLELEKP